MSDEKARSARIRAELRADNVRLRAALERIGNGDVPRPVAEPWDKKSGKPSKNDRCEHDEFMYADCGECIAAFARAALAQPAEAKP